MTTDTMTPMIPTPESKRATRLAFWGAPERNPYLISINEVADRIGIKRESMSTNASKRPLWFPFDVVTIGRAPGTGLPLRYYRRSEVGRWITQYISRRERAERARNRAVAAQDARNGAEMTPDRGNDAIVRTGDPGATERRVA